MATSDDTPEVNWPDYAAVLFDLDGVLTPTAEIHMRAWEQAFRQVLERYPDQRAYTDADYFDHVDGRPRLEGVATFLESRKIDLPQGDDNSGAGVDSVTAIGNYKNDLFTEILHRDGIAPYRGSVALLDHLQRIGVAVAVVSSSKNATDVLATAGLSSRFTVVVDGVRASELGLPGKPRPDTFRHAAHELGVESRRSVVVEDAVSGVRAGAAGDFALVVGVDRGVGAEALRSAGADVVVDDLALLT